MDGHFDPRTVRAAARTVLCGDDEGLTALADGDPMGLLRATLAVYNDQMMAKYSCTALQWDRALWSSLLDPRGP